MKTLILIMLIPVLALAWELPPGLELVSVNGDHVTVKDTRTGILDTYLIGGEPVMNGWVLDPAEDSLIFELVAELNMFLTEDLQSYDFLNDGYIELIGGDLVLGTPLVFLENDGNFNFTEVNRIDTGKTLFDLGDADNDGLIDILTQWQRSMFIYEQTGLNRYADSLVWQITPLEGSYRVWPKYTDLDNDNNFEVSHNNHTTSYYYIAVNENTGDNLYENFIEIQWPYGSPGDFAWGDFDGDGFMEIAGGSGVGYLSVFENAADDSFNIVWQEPFGHPNLTIHKFIGDTDGNGFSEWVSGSHDFSNGGFFFKVYEAVGNNQYEVVYYDSLPGNPWRLGGVDAGDVDGDDIPEFVFSSNFNVGVYKYESIAGWHRVWHLDSLQGTVIPYLVDTNGDGTEEVVIATSHIPNYTRIYELLQTNAQAVVKPVSQDLFIYPNPANDMLFINVPNDLYNNADLRIFDITGRIIFFRGNVVSTDKIIWDFKDEKGRGVGSGIYFIKISNLDFEYVKKFTILK